MQGNAVFVDSGSTLKRWTLPNLDVTSPIPFSESGRYLIDPVGSRVILTHNVADHPSLQLIDSNGASVRTFAVDDSPSPVAFTPDGKSLIAIARTQFIMQPDQGDELEFISLTGAAATRKIPLPGAPCCEGRYDGANGRLLLASSFSGSVALVNVFTDSEARRVLRRIALDDRLATMEFDPTGKRIVFGLAHGQVLVWYPDSGGDPVLLGALRNPITSIAFAPASDEFVATSDEGELGWFGIGSTPSLRAVSYWIESPGAWLTVLADGSFSATKDFPISIQSASGQEIPTAQMRQPDPSRVCCRNSS